MYMYTYIPCSKVGYKECLAKQVELQSSTVQEHSGIFSAGKNFAKCSCKVLHKTFAGYIFTRASKDLISFNMHAGKHELLHIENLPG